MIEQFQGVRGCESGLREVPGGGRVVAIRAPHARNLTVCLVVRAGMRSEQPGQQGVMHLLEHMVYQDSQTVRGLDRQQTVARTGGVLGGHTHMDYTEFYETGPAGDAGVVARRIVDQVFFPAFTEGQIAEQINAVATERRRRLASAPGGVLPWPHLSGIHWTDYANAHDGSGDDDLRERVDRDLLVELHGNWYRRQNAVLVALGPDPVPATLDALAEALQQAPGGTGRSQVGFSAGQGPHDSSATRVGAGTAERMISVTAAANSLRVTDEVLGDVLVAELLALQPGLDASAGQFGVGDVPQDDLFVIVDDTGFNLDPWDRVAAVPLVDAALEAHAVARCVHRVEQFTVDDERLTRSVARDSLLREDPNFMLTLVHRLTELMEDPERTGELSESASARLSVQVFSSMIIGA